MFRLKIEKGGLLRGNFYSLNKIPPKKLKFHFRRLYLLPEMVFFEEK